MYNCCPLRAVAKGREGIHEVWRFRRWVCHPLGSDVRAHKGSRQPVLGCYSSSTSKKPHNGGVITARVYGRCSRSPSVNLVPWPGSHSGPTYSWCPSLSLSFPSICSPHSHSSSAALWRQLYTDSVWHLRVQMSVSEGRQQCTGFSDSYSGKKDLIVSN